MSNPFEDIIERLERIETMLLAQANHAEADRLEKSKLEGRKRITRKELSIKLRVSLTTIDVWTRRGILKRYKQGGRYFFYEDEAMNAYIEMER